MERVQSAAKLFEHLREFLSKHSYLMQFHEIYICQAMIFRLHTVYTKHEMIKICNQIREKPQVLSQMLEYFCCRLCFIYCTRSVITSNESAVLENKYHFKVWSLNQSHVSPTVLFTKFLIPGLLSNQVTQWMIGCSGWFQQSIGRVIQVLAWPGNKNTVDSKTVRALEIVRVKKFIFNSVSWNIYLSIHDL